MTRNWWTSFWRQFLSPATARFVLAFSALSLAGWVMHTLAYAEIPAENRDPFMVGLGYIMGLVTAAYAFYFGTIQRQESRPTGKKGDPVHYEEDQP